MLTCMVRLNKRLSKYIHVTLTIALIKNAFLLFSHIFIIAILLIALIFKYSICAVDNFDKIYEKKYRYPFLISRQISTLVWMP